MKSYNPDSSHQNDQIYKILSAAEVGKLWVVYIGNSMSRCMLTYFLQHIHDQHIKTIVRSALNLSNEFLHAIDKIFKEENIPTPNGFTDGDVNLNAPRLFADEFYLHYLKYAAKAGLSLYSTAIPLMVRKDIRDFVVNCSNQTSSLLQDLNETMEKKGILNKCPVVPYPKNIDYVKKQSYLSGFFGNVRPLNALELAHLYENIENNITSRALLIGFSQVAKESEVKHYFERGRDLTMKHIEACAEELQEDQFPSYPLLDNLVEKANFSPFSDRLMLSHKINTFSMKIRAYANAMSLNGRRDIDAMYTKLISQVGLYVEDGANIIIKNGWMEQPPSTSQ